jgi:ABC-type Na+ efflux pump permease subunit
MNKLFSVVKREYVQGVRSKAFVISTILGPIMLMVFTVVPGLLFGMKTAARRAWPSWTRPERSTPPRARRS